ncbi:MAG: tetratricopeptide repeat protein [Betaproteobacteria bacterium]|nr:tetratricopeptide repeat protein [Betaproteobacteria bacterium]
MNTAFREISDNLPEWVKAYLLPAIAGTLLAVGAYSIHDWYTKRQNEKISLIYWQMEEAIHDEDDAAALEHFARLYRDGNDTQISFAAARIASFQYEQEEYEQAAANYDTVIALSPFETMRDLARLRKARVLASAGGDREDELAALVQSLEGTHPALLRTANILAADTRAAAGDFDQARELYTAVLEQMSANEGNSETELIEIIRLKLAILDSQKVIELAKQQEEDGSDAAPDSAAEAQSETQPDLETELESETEAETETETDSETETQPDLETELESETEAKTETETDSESATTQNTESE